LKVQRGYENFERFVIEFDKIGHSILTAQTTHLREDINIARNMLKVMIERLNNSQKNLNLRANAALNSINERYEEIYNDVVKPLFTRLTEAGRAKFGERQTKLDEYFAPKSKAKSPVVAVVPESDDELADLPDLVSVNDENKD